MWYNKMYESISKNNGLENEMTLDMSDFWYSDDGSIKNLWWSMHCIGNAKGSTVGRYPQPSGEASTGMISSISCSLVKSGELVSMQKLWSQLMHSRTFAATFRDTPYSCFNCCHLVVSNPKAISILILTWLKKRL